MQTTTLSDEIRPIVENGICVGCGACAIAADCAITMKRMPNGTYSAQNARNYDFIGPSDWIGQKSKLSISRAMVKLFQPAIGSTAVTTKQ